MKPEPHYLSKGKQESQFYAEKPHLKQSINAFISWLPEVAFRFLVHLPAEVIPMMHAVMQSSVPLSSGRNLWTLSVRLCWQGFSFTVFKPLPRNPCHSHLLPSSFSLLKKNNDLILYPTPRFFMRTQTRLHIEIIYFPVKVGSQRKGLHVESVGFAHRG